MSPTASGLAASVSTGSGPSGTRYACGTVRATRCSRPYLSAGVSCTLPIMKSAVVRITRVGATGSREPAKIENQVIVATTFSAIVVAATLAKHAGVDAGPLAVAKYSLVRQRLSAVGIQRTQAHDRGSASAI